MRKIERPNWDEYFMLYAVLAATRSSCLKLHTGAAVVKNKRVIATGYNGAPPNIETCLKIGCRKDEYKIKFDDKGKGVCRGTHAERNAMLQIPRNDLKGVSLYSVYFPCSDCAKDIAGAGVKEVVYLVHYTELDSLTAEIFSEAGIALREFKGFKIKSYLSMLENIVNQK